MASNLSEVNDTGTTKQSIPVQQQQLKKNVSLKRMSQQFASGGIAGKILMIMGLSV